MVARPSANVGLAKGSAQRRRRMYGKCTVLNMQQKEQTDRGTLFGRNFGICIRVWAGEGSIMTEMLCERREGSVGVVSLVNSGRASSPGDQVPYATVTLVAVSPSSGSRQDPSIFPKFAARYETKLPAKYLCRGGDDLKGTCRAINKHTWQLLRRIYI